MGAMQHAQSLGVEAHGFVQIDTAEIALNIHPPTVWSSGSAGDSRSRRAIIRPRQTYWLLQVAPEASRADISGAEKPQADSEAPLSAGRGPCLTSATVRLKRGAGAGCATPSISMNVLRAALWGCFGASLRESTGA